MATVVLTPDPQKFPNGSKLHFFLKPGTPWSETGKPPGSEVTEVTVTSGALTVTGVTEGDHYVGWAEVSSTDRYINFFVPTAESTSGLTKAEVEALIEEKAVSTVSPAFSGTPTAPTATALTKTTQLGTTAFTTDAVAVEKGRAETAEALKAPLASPTLTGTPAAPTAAPGTNSTQVATTAYADAIAALKANLASPTLTGVPAAPTAAALTSTTQLATTDFATKADTVERERAEAAEVLKALKLAVHASVVTNGTTATVNQFHPVNDEAESRTIKLPTGQPNGSIIGFEKSSAAAFEVTIEGSIRSEATTIKLRLQRQTVFFIADSAGSWWPLSMYVPLATLTTDYVMRTVSVPAGQVPGNEQLAEWKIELQGTEKRTIVKARIRTTSGTINVAIKRGEAGSTEITAYKELKGASTEEIVTSEQALSNKDRITVTTSGGSSPKGLFVDIWEKVEK